MRHYDLIQKVVNILDDNDFDILTYFSSCVDIAAQKKRLKLLIKVLENIDAMKKEQADDLKKLSAVLYAYPLLIGDHSKKEKLQNGVLYERYNISCLNPETFEETLTGAYPEKTYNRGRLIVEVNGEALKQARIRKGLSMEELARILNASKESIYYYEKNYMRMRYEIAERLKRILSSDIVTKKKPFIRPKVSLDKPSNEIANKLLIFDFDVYAFSKLQFNLGARDDKNSIFIQTEIPANTEKMKQLSNFFNALFAIVHENSKYDNLPVISPFEFKTARTKEELIKIIRERSN
ncbi:hypothetical protein DRN74_02875 [Candidatus Micrarchaeota archaeon]|nr:MAG: hypothetical protein DRN74_02875 [Candidatus Micrarchaeota archaeon]